MRVWLLILLQFSRLIAMTPAQIAASRDKAATESRAAAVRGLEMLRQLVNESNYRAMGFDTQEQVKTASLGNAIPIFTIDRKDLKEYKPEADASTLIRDCNRVVYPVLVSGIVKSGITLVKSGDQWVPAEYGRTTFVSSLERSVGNAAGHGRDSTFVVAVPSQNVYLKGKSAGREVEFQAIRMGSGPVAFGKNNILFSETPLSGKSVMGHLAETERSQSDERKVR